MKPGYKTTEFWGKVVLQLITIIGALKGTIDPDTATTATSILEGIYAIGRSVSKNKLPTS
jgi:hypothetical protein